MIVSSLALTGRIVKGHCGPPVWRHTHTKWIFPIGWVIAKD